MITPLSLNSPKGFYFIIYAAACLATLNVPTTLIFNTIVISSLDNTPLDVTRSPAEGMPAEFTTILIPPNSVTVY